MIARFKVDAESSAHWAEQDGKTFTAKKNFVWTCN
jgi:hypothetical protein